MLRYNYIPGDIVDIQKKYKIDYIVHQVNCQGKMGSGVAKRIKRNIFAIPVRLIHKSNRNMKYIALLYVNCFIF